MKSKICHKWIVLILLLVSATVRGKLELEKGFKNPPDSAKCWVYWWWLNGYVTKDGIVRDLDEMKNKGISGALVFHAGGGSTPKVTDFMSSQWREYFKFAVQQAAKRDITISLNLCAGWDAGGPWVSQRDAAKTMVNSVVYVKAPKMFSDILPVPINNQTYRDIAVIAWRLRHDKDVREKNICLTQTWMDLTENMDSNGLLTWHVPPGQWVVIRFGYYLNSIHGTTKWTGSSSYWEKNPLAGKKNIVKVQPAWGASYWEIDPLKKDAMDRHFEATAGVVLQDVADYVGSTFKYVHIDSGETGINDWTQAFRKEFQRLRGYDPFPYLAAKAGLVVENTAITERFLEDYNRTIGDLMIECYYGRLGELAHQHGLATHSEAAGYQKPVVDALRSLGCNDIVMSEFWSRQSDDYIHQLSRSQLYYHDGIKNASSAAHIYGKKIVQAEAFTVMRDVNFDRDLFAIKDIGDRAFCAGLNRNVLCFFISQPEQYSKPGYQWPGVGMEFDRHQTWWPMSKAWLTYLSRCQYLLQQGDYIADVCYYQGDWVPAYVPAKWAQNPPLPKGYDCDTINSEALLNYAEAGKNAQLLLPDSQSYRYLVLCQGGRWKKPPLKLFGSSSKNVVFSPYPDKGSGIPLSLSAEVLSKIKKLVQDGITLIGPRPNRSIGLTNYPDCDSKVKKLADELWGIEQNTVGERTLGKGRVIWGKSLVDIMKKDYLYPDLEIIENKTTASLPKETLSGIPNPGSFDWIHRSISGTQVYYIANLRNADAAGKFIFRVINRQPQLWDPVTGKIRNLMQFHIENGRTVVSLKFAPRQSLFIVFTKCLNNNKLSGNSKNFPELQTVSTIPGPWELDFDHDWGGPQKIIFEQLQDWSKQKESQIKYYSGVVTYRKKFNLNQAKNYKRLFLDLGEVKNIANVSLNGKQLGTVWCAPWHIEITDVVKDKGNMLVIDVANLWMNRLIGDANLPLEQRYTKTNVSKKYNPSMKLLPSGLLGPVRLIGIAEKEVSQ